MTNRTGRPVERPAPAEDAYLAADLRGAARALLSHPMLTAEGANPEEFRAVRRHREELVRRFADGFGYRLEVEPHTARLFKTGLGRDPSRGLRRRNGNAFSPRAYAMICLVLAALTRTKDQLLIDELVAAVRSAAVDAGVDVDLDAIVDRRALHAALTYLIDLGVLRERDHDGGGLARWADEASARSLLDVARDRLRLVMARSLHGVSSPDQLLDIASLPSAAGGARVAIRRRLVESPVLSIADLTEDEASWWRRNRHREHERLRDLVGLDLELRAEGALAVDPQDELSDIDFPGRGSTKHFALLLLERLAAWCAGDGAGSAPSDDGAWWPVPGAVVDESAARVRREYPTGFSKAHLEDPALQRAEATELLRDLGLVRTDSAGDWRLHAAAARYRAHVTLAGPGPGGETSLFAEEER